MALTLLAARHAATDAEGLCVGQHDVPTFITPEQAAAAIREQVARVPDVVHSSPLSRCAQPAALLAAAWGCPHRVDARLLEIHYGVWQGRAWTAIELEDGERFAEFMQHWQHAAPPGGEGLRDLERRVASWYAELGAGDHLLVAHAGVVRALRVLTGGGDWASAMQRGVPHLLVETLVSRS
ncbi:MAG: histidine phosphatase family protein [Sandaracinaceae bacterium]|nr:histidine phosphatase family protein [Sandaracinaceae bacterium]